MGLILWVSFLVLLLVSYVDQRKTMDAKNWLMVIGVYFVCEFSVNLFGLVIPVGFIIALLYVKKKINFPLSKALIFGLISVYAISYAPKITFNQIKEISQTSRYSNEFNQIKSVSNFSSESDINAVLKTAAEGLKDKNPASEIRIEDPHVTFSIWALNHKNIAIKDLDWLWYEAPRELHYYWQSNRPEPLIDMEYVIFHDVGYMGVFQRDDTNSPFYLRTIYEFDRLKMNNVSIP
ncbi:hypothetical protein Back11_57380 [Paenibacillus baekrokdamisoli]|uniref:Uncharacterized protein n=1 Tax=Paenibacillus baekrokdamisoli TaxID=1712516 RepID=A0A3G9JHE5_9BACL|nr:hypothetical protein [Paenibacillus baekrokdamisoli]MBB3072833.1 hypothetical protein [Paenibacillus baekrokdamisoli]BBH24393.1 hypothetical protein Back11_57380 [Paenibacillus baekrokdamisoli]